MQGVVIGNEPRGGPGLNSMQSIAIQWHPCMHVHRWIYALRISLYMNDAQLYMASLPFLQRVYKTLINTCKIYIVYS